MCGVTGAAITLLHALETRRYHAPEPGPLPIGVALAHEERHAAEAQKYLEALAKRHSSPGLAVRTRLVRGRHTALAIIEEAASGHDLVALTTHGRGGIKRLLLGSVADKVVRGAPIPVLVYCPACLDAAAASIGRLIASGRRSS